RVDDVRQLRLDVWQLPLDARKVEHSCIGSQQPPTKTASLPPMSMVMNLTCPEWAWRNFVASLSWEPEGYVQGLSIPEIKLSVVSPLHPNFTSRNSLNLGRRRS